MSKKSSSDFIVSKAGFEVLTRGNDALDHRDYFGALDAFTRLIEIEDSIDARAFAYLQRGLVYMFLEEINQAIRDWTQVININPATDLMLMAYNNRAKILGDSGEIGAAISDLSQVIQLTPDHAEAYNARSHLHLKNGDVHGAITDLSLAIRLNPDNYVYYLNRGLVLHQHVHDFTNALADYNQAVRLEPKDADSFFYRGIVLIKLNRLEEATSDLNTAIYLNPHNCLHYGKRGELRLIQNDFNGAIADFEHAIQLSQECAGYYKSAFAEALAKRSMAYAENGAFQKALVDAEKAISVYPSHYLGYYARANAYHYFDVQFDAPTQMSDQAYSAITNYTNVIQIKPDFAAAYASRAMLWSKYGELEHAFEDMKTALKLVPSQSQWLATMQMIVNSLANDGYTTVTERGVLFMDINWDEYLQSRLRRTANYDPKTGIVLPSQQLLRTSPSEQITEKILTLSNTEVEVQNLLEIGVQRKRNQDFSSAKEAYYAAISLKSDSILAYYGLAKICYLTKEPREAISNYLKALHLSVYATAQAADGKVNQEPFQLFLTHLPENIQQAMNRIHPFAKWMLLDQNTPRHLAHVIIDLNSKFPKTDRIKKYRVRYRKALLGKSEAELNDTLENSYFGVGVEFALNNLDWGMISDLSVTARYNDTASLNFGALSLFDQSE